MIKVSVHILALGFPFSQALSTPFALKCVRLFKWDDTLSVGSRCCYYHRRSDDTNTPERQKYRIYIYKSQNFTIKKRSTDRPTDRPTRQTSGKMSTWIEHKRVLFSHQYCWPHRFRYTCTKTLRKTHAHTHKHAKIEPCEMLFSFCIYYNCFAFDK